MSETTVIRISRMIGGSADKIQDFVAKQINDIPESSQINKLIGKDSSGSNIQVPYSALYSLIKSSLDAIYRNIADSYTKTEVDGLVAAGIKEIQPTSADDAIAGIKFPTESGTYTNYGGTLVDLTEGLTMIFSDGAGGFTKTVVPIDLAGYATLLNVAEIEHLASSKASKITGKNLFNVNDPENALDKYVNDVNGALLDNTSYNATHFIQVEAGLNYTVNYKHNIAYYDANKVYISGSSASSSPGKTLLIPATAYFIRCTVSKSAWDGFQLEKGTVSTSWEPYSSKGLEAFAEKTELADVVGDLNTLSEIKTDKIPGKNLFNINHPDSLPLKYIDETTGEVLPGNSNYLASHFIEVEPGETYALSYGNRTAFYDENKTYISGVLSSSQTRTAPANARYIRVTTNNVSTFQIEKGNFPTSFEPFELKGLEGLVKLEDVKLLFDNSETSFFENTYKKDALTSLEESNFQEGGSVWGNTDSTFSGWGTPLGSPLNEFNSVIVKIRARGPNEIKLVRFRIFIGDVTGTLLADKTIPVSILPGEIKNINCIFDAVVNYPVGSKLFLLWQCDQYADRYGIHSTTLFPVADGWGVPKYTVNGNMTSLGFDSTGKSELTYAVTSFSTPLVGFSDTFINYIQEKLGLIDGFEPTADILLPSVLYTTEGVETNVFWDNIIFSNYPLSKLKIDVSSSLGAQFERGWRYTPAGSALDANLTVSVYFEGTLLATKTATVKTKGISEGPTAINVLCVGDSTTAGGQYVNIINTDYNVNPTVTFLGTQGSGSNKHEGYSGKTFAWFVGSESPFWNNSTAELDFGTYLSANGWTMGSNDLISLHLGINDIFHGADEAKLNTIKADCLALIAEFRRVVPGVNIALCITIPPSISQDAFGDDYQNSYDLATYIGRYKAWVSFMLENFDNIGNRTDKIFMAGFNCNIDRTYNFPYIQVPANSRTATLVTKQTNGVHPSNEGYYQMGDVLWGFIKNLS